MREAKVSRRRENLPDTFTDTELLETFDKMIKKGWVMSMGYEKVSLVGPGTTYYGNSVRSILNSVTKERMERFL